MTHVPKLLIEFAREGLSSNCQAHTCLPGDFWLFVMQKMPQKEYRGILKHDPPTRLLDRFYLPLMFTLVAAGKYSNRKRLEEPKLGLQTPKTVDSYIEISNHRSSNLLQERS